MPEMYFDVRWPDGATQRCYSPSTVIEDYFTAGVTYELADFLERSRTALGIAGLRVREKFGFHCTGASGQLEQIEETARVRAFPADSKVVVEALLDAEGGPR
ncbi:MSMEG_0570 family nitrogen starvation response protein [Streptomyces sp. NPDC004629]|uniref:MSMEG_0570 family nitrogen starvation response protein n=1 Tax=Streptomyces sp. NPDC004629 TaxID=3364705 RepID=UPI003681208C